MLLGRVTYQGFAQAWPGRTDEVGFADKMNFDAEVRDLQYPGLGRAGRTQPWCRATWSMSCESSASDTSGDLLVAGSARLVHTLTEHDLVDEYRLMVFPILLGSGKRLFEERDTAQSLKLVESRPTADVVLVRLQPDRE